jgi:hypothetical protein
MIQARSEFEPLDIVEPPLSGSASLVRSTVAHALVAALMSWLSIVVPAVFIHAGLRYGWKGALGSVFGAVALLGVVAVLAAAPPIGGDDLTAPLTMLFELGVPALVAVVLIRNRRSLGLVLVASIATAAAGLFAGELLLRVTSEFSPYARVVETFRTMSAETIEFYRKGGFPPEGIRAMERVARGIGDSFIPALLIFSTVVTFTFSMILVPRFAYGRLLGPAYLFRNLAFPDWLLLGFVAGGISPLLHGSVRLAGLNLLAIVICLYLIQGLAIFRAFVLRLPFGFFGSAIAWLMLAVLPQVSLPLMFLMGLFDPFFDFRKLNRKESSNESDSD